MIAAAKICGVNLCQTNQMPKLIMTHGIHLTLSSLLFIYRYLCLDGASIVGKWCSTPYTDSKEALYSVPIWFIAILCTRYCCPGSGGLLF